MKQSSSPCLVYMGSSLCSVTGPFESAAALFKYHLWRLSKETLMKTTGLVTVHKVHVSTSRRNNGKVDDLQCGIVSNTLTMDCNRLMLMPVINYVLMDM